LNRHSFLETGPQITMHPKDVICDPTIANRVNIVGDNE
jgi:hypothetical protein